MDLGEKTNGSFKLGLCPIKSFSWHVRVSGNGLKSLQPYFSVGGKRIDVECRKPGGRKEKQRLLGKSLQVRPTAQKVELAAIKNNNKALGCSDE